MRGTYPPWGGREAYMRVYTHHGRLGGTHREVYTHHGRLGDTYKEVYSLCTPGGIYGVYQPPSVYRTQC